MGLPACRRCGVSDADRMIGLMTLWFGALVDLEPAHGYFHLCPACFGRHIAPGLDGVQKSLVRLNPSAAAYLERERAADRGASSGAGSEELPDALPEHSGGS